ncbi:MAG TPA: hypothetical protein VHT96_03170 [Clostridia bacterium]|nr:hypothetical protein [Clostridia bacterium]
MLGKLTKFELVKKWKSSKFLLLGYVLIQAVILFVLRVFIWNDEISRGFNLDGVSVSAGGSVSASFGDSVSAGNGVSASFVLLTVLFFMLSLVIGAYPFVESIYRYERDLSGRQAYLELMIPAVGWKKVLSKLIATMVSLVICGTLSVFSMFMYFTINSNFRYVMDLIRYLGELIVKEGPEVALMILFMLFGFASTYMTIFFCISVAKSFTHKNTVAVPIGIFVFILILSLLGLITTRLSGFPIVNYNIGTISFTLSSTLLDIAVFFATLAGTSWLMEKKIEH